MGFRVDLRWISWFFGYIDLAQQTVCNSVVILYESYHRSIDLIWPFYSFSDLQQIDRTIVSNSVGNFIQTNAWEKVTRSFAFYL